MTKLTFEECDKLARKVAPHLEFEAANIFDIEDMIHAAVNLGMMKAAEICDQPKYKESAGGCFAIVIRAAAQEV